MEKVKFKKINTECITWRWNGNLGDDLIYGAQEELFKNTFNFGQYIKDPKAVFVGGGTFIFKGLHHPNLLEFSRKLPTVIFGTGVADQEFFGENNIPVWLEIINNCKFVGVRGPLSYEKLIEWGAPKNKIKWIGDSALYYAKYFKKKKSSGKRIAINVGTTFGKLYGGNELNLEQSIINLIKELIKKGWHVTLISAWSPDDDMLERIKSSVRIKSIEYWYDDFKYALESVEKFDIVLSQKLHVSVVAACRGVPFVALNYRSKVLDFCRSISWQKFCVSTNNINNNEIIKLIEIISNDPKEYINQLIDNVMSVRRKLIEASNEIKGIFK